MALLERIVEGFKPVLQPIRIRSALEIWDTEELPVARLEWVHGPRKPRDLVREREPPAEDVSLQSLARRGLVRVLDPVRIESPGDVSRIPRDVDALVMGDMEDWLVDEEVLEALVSLGKPVIYEWDRWGMALHGRLSKLRLDRFSGRVRLYIPMRAREVLAIIRALRGVRLLRNLRILYIGEYPPRSVAVPSGLGLGDVSRRLGPSIKRIGFSEYYRAVEEADEGEARDVASRWLRDYEILDGREKHMLHYAKIYVGLKRLLREHGANAVTIECPGLKDAEYVPCLAFSHLLDEGVPCGCEADIPTLLALSLLMGVSGEPAIMGNLNENVTHADIESGIVVVNHDIVTRSYGCRDCKLRVRDFHASGRGATPYIDLPAGMEVTLAGMHWNLDRIWATRGRIAWTMDTVHCRISIGVRVEDPVSVSRRAFGHHVALVRGNWIEELRVASEILGIGFVIL